MAEMMMIRPLEFQKKRHLFEMKKNITNGKTFNTTVKSLSQQPLTNATTAAVQELQEQRQRRRRQRQRQRKRKKLLNQQIERPAIVMLLSDDDHDFETIQFAIRSMDTFLIHARPTTTTSNNNNNNNNFVVPLYIFHEGNLGSQKMDILVNLTNRPIYWPIVDFQNDFPPGFQPNTTFSPFNYFKRSSKWGYMQMCRFWTTQIWYHSALENITTLMRLDSDSCFVDPTPGLPYFVSSSFLHSTTTTTTTTNNNNNSQQEQQQQQDEATRKRRRRRNKENVLFHLDHQLVYRAPALYNSRRWATTYAREYKSARDFITQLEEPLFVTDLWNITLDFCQTHNVTIQNPSLWKVAQTAMERNGTLPFITNNLEMDRLDFFRNTPLLQRYH